jgi:ABC-type multidrug transport system fused ATPase/permease subunit
LAKIRQQLADHIARLPVPYLEERHSGDFLSVINDDLTKLQTLFSDNMLNLFGQSIRFIGAFGYIFFFISWKLTLVATLMTPLAFVIMSKVSQPVPKRSKEMQNAIGEVNHVAQDGLGGLLISRVFNLTGIMDARYRRANERAVEKGFAIARLTSKIDIIGYAVSILPFIVTCSVGGYLVIQQQMTFGGLLTFINLLNHVANPLGSIPRIWGSIAEATGSAERLYEVLDHDVERTGGRTFRPQPKEGTAIDFDGVHFAYEEGAALIEDADLKIPNGQTVAVVGPSGSGKSTLLKLILGFYPVSEGSIALWGHDLKDWQLDAARQSMAFVAQDTYLFPVSIAENIACGRSDVSREAVEQAAKAANIHAFITSLPEGYDTQVGERGARLSGGQRQRIALARAILKDAPLLLLDEPTSALDTESEALVQEALDRFMVDRTTVVIAHRLSTIREADRILVLDDGRIVQEGTHSTLTAQPGLYRDLYQQQFAAADTARRESYA